MIDVSFDSERDQQRRRNRKSLARRECERCEEIKPESQYAIVSHGKDTMCKKCRRIQELGPWSGQRPNRTWLEYAAEKGMTKHYRAVVRRAAEAYAGFAAHHRDTGSSQGYEGETVVDVLECYESDWPLAAKLYTGACLLGTEMLAERYGDA